MLEQNKALVRRFVDEMLNKGSTAVVDELVAADFIDHDAPPDQVPGPESVKRSLLMVRESLRDFRVSTADIIAEGDRVVTRHTAEATQAGPFLGSAPTGKCLRWTAISIYRIENGKLTERRGPMDYRGLQRQLGS